MKHSLLVAALLSGSCGSSSVSVDASATIDTAPACTGGVQTVAEPVDAPYGMALSATDVYWTTAVLDGAKTVTKSPRTTAAPQIVVSTSLDIGAVVTDRAGQPYWIEAAASDVGGGTIKTSNNGVVTTLFTVAPGAWLDSFGIAVDDTAVYWLIHNTDTFVDQVFAGAKNGTGQPRSLGTMALPFATNVRRAQAATDGYYWGYGSGNILRVPLNGGATTTVVNEADGIGDFTVADSGIYYIVRDTGGSVKRVTPTPTPPQTLAANIGARFAIAVQGTTIAVSTSDNRIITLPIAGGTPTLVTATGVTTAGALALDGDYLFWGNTATRTAGGAVRRACIP